MNASTRIAERFAAALAQHGLCPPEIVADGKLHRFDAPDEKRGKRSAWYVLYGDGQPAGSFGDWRSGLAETWSSQPERNLTADERRAHRERIEQAKAQAAAERATLAEVARMTCVRLWDAAALVHADHPYVKRKQIKPAGAKQLRDALLIPLQDTAGALRSLQFIQPDGSRRFKTGGIIAACYCAVGGPPRADVPLLVCEGWATACSLHQATGYPVGAAMSAGNLPAVAKALKVAWPDTLQIICADDDAATPGNPGLTRAREAAAAVGARLAVPNFGDTRPAGATDFNDLHQLDGLGAVKRCLDAVRRPVAPPTSGGERGSPTATPSVASVNPEVMLARAADITPEPITWLWPAWLPAGKLSILAGSPGTGKTTLALALASIVSRGGAWPDGVLYRDVGNVLIWSGEDDPADTLVPRLMAAGADLHRVYFVRSVADESGALQPFDPARDIPLLGARLDALGDVRLLIIDPIVSAVSGDAHRANDVRRDLQGVVDLATGYRCAVLGISHFAKGTKGRSPAERVIGSQSFVALARMVLVAGKDEAAERRILACAKSNIAPDEGGVAYAIEQVATDGIEASRIVWGGMIEGTARDILGDVEQDDEEKSLRDEARDFLAGLLADGAVSAKEIKKDADAAGFSWPTIHRAASELGVEKRKLGMKEGWVWAIASKISAGEDFTKISTLCSVKSSGVREIFGNHAGLRVVHSGVSAEDFSTQGVKSSGDNSADCAEDEV